VAASAAAGGDTAGATGNSVLLYLSLWEAGRDSARFSFVAIADERSDYY
jgi:hypothetical protein